MMYVAVLPLLVKILHVEQIANAFVTRVETQDVSIPLRSAKTTSCPNIVICIVKLRSETFSFNGDENVECFLL